jgi:hypothetical protein
MLVGGALVSQAVPLEHRGFARSAFVAAARRETVAHEFDGLDGHPLQAQVLAELERLTVYADGQEQKVSQLKSALDSRVVIEQAIGMPAEQFHLPFADAYELLRAGARNTRQQVRVIAEELRQSRQTPSEIRDLLPRDASSPLSMSTVEPMRCPHCGAIVLS